MLEGKANMSPNLIEYNTVFGVVREKEEWFLSERKNKKNFPIFDLEGGSWCSVGTSKNNLWFILFYNSRNTGNSKFYKSFAKFDDSKSSFKFTNFVEVEKGLDGMWTNVKQGQQNQLGN